jgi:hypothetical protein
MALMAMLVVWMSLKSSGLFVLQGGRVNSKEKRDILQLGWRYWWTPIFGLGSVLLGLPAH